MNTPWTERNSIVANLFNPAFCGEIIRVVAKEYNKNGTTPFPYAFTFLVLPILLHRETREKMPRTVRTYFFVWVEQNDHLFYDFAKRTRGMVKYTKEALTFLMHYQRISINEAGGILTDLVNSQKFAQENYEEYDEIIKKAEMLGKWLSSTSDVKSIYSFFRITP